jgi:hypothetical protein
MKVQLFKYLPALLQIQNGLQVCGLLKTIRENPVIWESVFKPTTVFTITADEFIDSLDVQYSTSQVKKSVEIDTFKFFCDVVENIDAG